MDAMPRPYFLDQPAANGVKWQDLLQNVEPCVDQVGNLGQTQFPPTSTRTSGFAGV